MSKKWEYAAKKYATDEKLVYPFTPASYEAFLEGCKHAESKILDTLSMDNEERWLRMRNLEAENLKFKEALASIAMPTYRTELCNTDEDNNEILALHMFAHQQIARDALNKDPK